MVILRIYGKARIVPCVKLAEEAELKQASLYGTKGRSVR
jgi:hypothetical protein